MAKFSKYSKKQLTTCCEELQLICNYVIQFYDFKVSEGHRSKELQDYYYEIGKSKVKYPDGKHNTIPSDAVDVDPYPVNFDDEERYYILAGIVKAVAFMHEIKIRWGGDWDNDDDVHDQSFNDLRHFEVMR